MSSPDGVDEISTIEDDVRKGASAQSGCDNPKPARAAFDAADDADVMNSPEEKAPKKNKNLGWYMWGFAGKMIWYNLHMYKMFCKILIFQKWEAGKGRFFLTLVDSIPFFSRSVYRYCLKSSFFDIYDGFTDGIR